MTSIPGSDIQVRHASLLHVDAIIDFNIAMAQETEGKLLDIEVVRPGVEAVFNRNDLGSPTAPGTASRDCCAAR